MVNPTQQAATPFAAMLGRGGLSVEAITPFGGVISVMHQQSTGRDVALTGPETYHQQFYYGENSERPTKRLTAISYGASFADRVRVVATVGRLHEGSTLLGSQASGAFAQRDTNTDYMEVSLNGRLFGL